MKHRNLLVTFLLYLLLFDFVVTLLRIVIYHVSIFSEIGSFFMIVFLFIFIKIGEGMIDNGNEFIKIL